MHAEATRRQVVVFNALRLALAALLFAGLARTIADADLWGHVLFGRDILELGHLPSRDQYSFTSDIPWVNHEWVAEILAYSSYRFGGSAGLVALKSLLVAGMLLWVLLALRPVAGDPVLHDLLVFLAAAGTYGRTITFRPQVFSLFLFPALLWLLLTAERGRSRALIGVPLVFLLWVNLHGGWIVGLAAFGLWSAWALVRPYERLDRVWVLSVGLMTVLATLLNPYGPGLWKFVAATVGFSRDIVDWQPLWRLPVPLLTPWITLTALAAGAIYVCRKQLNPAHVAIVALCWAGSLRVNRLDAFFVISAVMLLAPNMRALLHGRRDRAVATPPRVGPLATSTRMLPLVAAALFGIAAGTARFSCIPIDEQWAPEADAVFTAKDRALNGRMLTFFDWGEYAIWHLAPAVQVSMDGRRETVYSEALIQAHFDIYRNAPDALQKVSDLGPHFIWLPARWPVLKRMEDGGWVRIFSGPKSAILARTAQPGPVRPPRPPSNARCFPGP